MEEIVRDLLRLRHYAAGLQQLMADLERAAPQRSEGTDRSGMVRAVIGGDGLPESIRLSPHWKDRLAPEAFGAAVTEACQAATRERGTVWAQVLQSVGWQDRLGRLEADAARAAAAGPGPVPAAFRRADDARPRPLDVLAGEVMGALDAANDPAARARPHVPSGTGANRSRALVLTLSPAGQVSCQADPRWVARQTGAQLTEALAAALAAARENLAAARRSLAAAAASDAASGTAAERPSQLTTEVLAALDDVVHHPENLDVPNPGELATGHQENTRE